MPVVKILEQVMQANDAWAERTRAHLKEKGIIAFNLIGSAGSGKTSLLEKSFELMGRPERFFVMEGDIATTRDAERIDRCGVDVVQITTGIACHIDAHLIHQALGNFNLEGKELLFIENVGNLVCPAEFDIGETAKITIASTAEGDEKPLKYPLVFQESELVVLTKVDLLPYLDFNLDEFRANVARTNPKVRILETSIKTGKGFDAWVQWLEARLSAR